MTTQPPWTIRALDLDDPRDVSSFEGCIAHLYTELFDASVVPSAEQWGALWAQRRATSPALWAFVVEGDEPEPWGMCCLAESFAVFAHGRYGVLNELWVAEAVRSRGIGAALITHCRSFGREQGWARIDVSAPPDRRWDRTFAFYQRTGFRLTGRKLKLWL